MASDELIPSFGNQVPSKREVLLDTALDLFARHGYRGAGINSILRESGVAKKTLYSHFPSKDDLIVAVIDYYGKKFIAFLAEELSGCGLEGEELLLFLFDAGHKWAKQNNYSGCMCINAIGEYGEDSTDVRIHCARFKTDLLQLIAFVCRQCGAAAPSRLAAQLFILFEGAFVVEQIRRTGAAFGTAKETASILFRENNRAI